MAKSSGLDFAGIAFNDEKALLMATMGTNLKSVYYRFMKISFFYMFQIVSAVICVSFFVICTGAIYGDEGRVKIISKYNRLKMNKTTDLTSMKAEAEKIGKISFLHNSYKYFIQHALVIQHGESYRLLVIHECKILADQYYKTCRGARIAFTRIFLHRRWKETVVLHWSSLYEPGIE
ncbi:MAG: hypothetical protein KAW12_12340, partial [Candidatus Aminicenantes bacterium]|nr:hypothetical protein [Candidatus Aminicenantes bacterium]